MNKTLLTASAIAAAALQFGCANPSWRDHDGFRARATVHFQCKGSSDCGVPVYVGFDVKPHKCAVTVLLDEVQVGRGQHPNVIWALDRLDPNDGYYYQFDRVSGVSIDKNDSTLDFDNGHAEHNGQAFSWHSVNKQPVSLKYTVNVQYSMDPHGPWQNCAPLDPTIVNAG
jgi:hypothetical protein